MSSVLILSGEKILDSQSNGGGNVTGPGSSTANAIAVFTGTSGKTIGTGTIGTLGGTNPYLALIGTEATGYLGKFDSAGTLQLAYNRNPQTGVIGSAVRTASYINIVGVSGSGRIEFYTSNTNNAQPFELCRIGGGGSFHFTATVTAAGTTGAQTINKAAGSVNFAAAATSLVVTNNLVTATSMIFCQIATNDASAVMGSVVAGAGSFTIRMVTGPTAELRVNFWVINPL